MASWHRISICFHREKPRSDSAFNILLFGLELIIEYYFIGVGFDLLVVERMTELIDRDLGFFCMAKGCFFCSF